MPETEVIITDMSDEELQIKIDTPVEEIKEEIKEEKQEVKEEVKQEVKEEIKEEIKEPVVEEVKITKEEYDKLVKRIDEKERFIQRQAQEVGIRRKSEEQLRGEVFELQKSLELKWGEPIEATKIQNEIRDRETQLQDAENRTRVENIRNVVKTYVPEPESLMDEMVILLKEDGNPEDSIRTFRDNPYSQPPGTLVNLAKRAELRKEGRNKDEKIASLEAEIQTLKGKPQETVKKIEKALKESPAMSNDSGQATATKKSVDETQVHAMSDKELEQYLKENTS